jgi:hypothetical protein
MFELDRTFCQSNSDTGLMEWYFNAREGVYGPYRTKQIAEKELKIFINRHKINNDDGGRKSGKKPLQLFTMPLDISLEPKSTGSKKKDFDDEWSKG